MTAPTLPPIADAEPDEGPRRRRPSLRGSLRGLRPMGAATRSPWVLGVVAALWAALIGFGIALVPMVLMWMASPDTGLTWTQSLRLGTLLWVVAHGVPLVLSGVTYSLVPWGLALIPLLLLGYAGGWAGRRAGLDGARSAVPVVVAGALTYAILIGIAASLSAESLSRTPIPIAALHGLLLSAAALGWGALRAAGVTLGGGVVAVTVRAGLAATLTIVAVAALVAAASLLVHVDDAITMTQSLGAGLGGGLGLLVLALGYVPVLVMWAAAYVLGAGVVIGPGVTASPFLTVTAPVDLPPFPLLAALPPGAPALAWLLPLTGVLAGVVAGVLIGRRARPEQRLTRLAMAAGAALVAGAVLALGAWLADGGLGTDRLAWLGPVPATVGVLAAVLVVLGAAPSAVAPSSTGRRQLSVARPDPTSHAHPAAAEPPVEEEPHE